MIGLPAVRELFAHNDWARDKLLACAAGLSAAQLDRPFEMGAGSLGATLRHLYGAERIWLTRWRGAEQPRWPHAHEIVALADLQSAWLSLSAARNEDLAGWRADDLRRSVTYTDIRGATWTHALGDILLHVCNHGLHHRAQTMNMLRQLGVRPPQPGLDYVFMKREQGDAPPPALDVGTLRAYHAYADWARQAMHAAAAQLSDEQLDRPFEMGAGSLRATLVHIRDAEQWWYDNWMQGAGRLFPRAGARCSVVELTRLFDETAARRNELLAKWTDADLQRPTSATPRAGVTMSFPLGVTMLQLCCHGTHHRAQAANMLRHVGAAVPALDYVTRLRERAHTAGATGN